MGEEEQRGRYCKMVWGGAGIEISAQPFSSLEVIHGGQIHIENFLIANLCLFFYILTSMT